MLIPMKIDYALRLLVYLSVNKDKGLIKTEEVSKDQGVPLKFLQRISNELQKEGIIESSRGPLGGHKIKTDPKKLFVSQIIKLLDYTLSPIECIHNEDVCIHTDACSQRELWIGVEAVLLDHLSNISIQDLADRQSSLNTKDVSFI
ncbi:MAG: hypothetical protein CL745_04480 [Chloroflexi bacterium]|nr:hypothetical protein [Chloroflexota bacterium]|tara:strand:- start:65321 stop:65758 length:438 start_codon:yes stop_codon:yes gene_type:complete